MGIWIALELAFGWLYSLEMTAPSPGSASGNTTMKKSGRLVTSWFLYWFLSFWVSCVFIISSIWVFIAGVVVM